MIKRRYKLPIKGTILALKPLTGADDNPIGPTPLEDLPNFLAEGYSGCLCLDYNIDEEWCEVEVKASEEFHNWLTGILPELRGIQNDKGWKLDKSKMVEKLI